MTYIGFKPGVDVTLFAKPYLVDSSFHVVVDAALGHPPKAAKALLRIARRISVNAEFKIFNSFYFRADAFPGIAAAPLGTLDGANLKQLLGGESNMLVTEMRQRVSLVKFSKETADATGVKSGTQGILLESAALAGREPLYYLE